MPGSKIFKLAVRSLKVRNAKIAIVEPKGIEHELEISNESTLIKGAVKPRSDGRLICQINLSDKLDGLVVRLPDSQN